MDDLVQIQNLIYVIRGQRVMLDSDLAMLYETETRTLNQAVKRNIERFPSDFMFRLSKDEANELITNCDRFKTLKHSPTTPYAFTEHGVAMLSSVLNSKKAVEINIQIVRAFIQLRQYATEHKDLARRLDDLEHYFIEHCKDDKQNQEEAKRHLAEIYEAISLLMDRTKPSKIGFKTD